MREEGEERGRERLRVDEWAALGGFCDVTCRPSEQLLLISDKSKQSLSSSKYVDLPRKLELSLCQSLVRNTR